MLIVTATQHVHVRVSFGWRVGCFSSPSGPVRDKPGVIGPETPLDPQTLDRDHVAGSDVRGVDGRAPPGRHAAVDQHGHAQADGFSVVRTDTAPAGLALTLNRTGCRPR